MAGTAVAAPIVRHRSKGVVRIEVACATDATADGGDITERVIGEAYGRIVGCYSDGGFDAAAVITIAHAASLSDATVGAPLFTYTTGTEGTPAAFRPTTNVTDNAGTAVAAALTALDVWRDIYAAGKLTIKVDNMGVSESGRFVLLIDESASLGNLHDVALT
jgi:hypothetical protein